MRSEGESLDGVESSGEAGGGAVNEDSVAVSNINNHANLARVFSIVNVGNSPGFDEVLENLNIISTYS